MTVLHIDAAPPVTPVSIAALHPHGVWEPFPSTTKESGRFPQSTPPTTTAL